MVVFHKMSNISLVLFDIITVCVFQMVIHDVLIIGSGPHALTLASLLSSNDWDPNSDLRHDSLLSTSTTKSQPSTETSSNKPNTSKMKRKKRVTDGIVCLALLSQNWEDVIIVAEDLSVHRKNVFWQLTKLSRQNELKADCLSHCYAEMPDVP